MIVVTILLWCMAVIAGIILVIVLSPFQAHLQGSFDNGSPSGAVMFSFIHPAVLRVSMDFGTGMMQIRLFGWQPGKRKKTKEPFSSDTHRTEADESGPVYHAQPHKQEEPNLPKPPEVSVSPPEPEVPEPLPQKNRPNEKVESEALPESAADTAVVPEPLSVEPAMEKKEPSDVSGVSTHRSEPLYRDESVEKNRQANQANQDNPQSSSSGMQENVAPKRKKRDNWLEKIKNSIVTHFLGDRKWRSGVIRWVLRFFKSLFFIIRFDRFRLQVKAGVENPMLTGTVSGYANAVGAVLRGNDRYLFSFEPVFMRNYFAGSLQFRVRTSLFSILFPLLFAVVSFPWIRTLLLYWLFRRKKKRRQRMALA